MGFMSRKRKRGRRDTLSIKASIRAKPGARAPRADPG